MYITFEQLMLLGTFVLALIDLIVSIVNRNNKKK